MEDKKTYEPAYSVFRTTDYGMFKLLKFNRVIDDQHVQRLVKEIKTRDLLAEFPILVSDTFDVLDGQHRLEAAKRLKLPVYFIKSDNLGHSSISRINSTQKPWTVLDYIEWYANTGQPDYVKLTDFLNKYAVQPTVAADLLRGSRPASGSRDIQNGTFQVKDEDGALKVIGYINEIAAYNFRAAWATYFVRALVIVSRIPGYDHAHMMRKVEDMPRRLVKCPDQKGYIEMLLEIYNHGQHRKLEYKK